MSTVQQQRSTISPEATAPDPNASKTTPSPSTSTNPAASPSLPSSSSATAATKQDVLNQLDQCFLDTQLYLKSEATLQQEEWRFAERCNQILRARYGKLQQKTDAVIQTMQESQALIAQLPSYYAQVDAMVQNLESLEAVVKGLESYCAGVEERVVGRR